MNGFTSPNYTQTPNDLFGEIGRGFVTPGLMADMGLAELKVVLAVCRITFGFHRETGYASLTTLERLTGLSRQGVIDGAEAAEKRGLIHRNHDNGVTCWTAVVNAVDQPDEPSQASRPLGQAGGPSGQASRPPSSKETQKQTTKQKRVKADAPPLHPAIAAFHTGTGKYPNAAMYNDIEATVGSDPGDCARFQKICHAYVGCGWNARNVLGMLNFYREGKIPGDDLNRPRAGPGSGVYGRNVNSNRRKDQGDGSNGNSNRRNEATAQTKAGVERYLEEQRRLERERAGGT